jgi:hypothetical protein
VRCRLALSALLPLAGLAALLPAAQPASAGLAGARPRPGASSPPARRATAFTRTVIRLGAFRVLTVQACLEETSGSQSALAAGQAVTLQYRVVATRPWRGLRTITPGAGSSYCAARGPAWRATVTAPASGAFYRLSFAGTAALAPAVTVGVHLWRDATRVTGFTVTPRRVAAGGAITISGRLWRRAAGWQPYPGRAVLILFHYQGEWYVFSFRPQTNGGGYFSGRFVARATARWVAQYDGDSAHFGSASPAIPVTVTGG